uniref:Uncharacterized protein n=1 Tax=candidate division WOR-3 bacterium TaxID=2052148 RepID=A0A7C3UQ41_UNCW3
MFDYEKEDRLNLFPPGKLREEIMKGPYRIEWLDHYLEEKLPGVFMCSNDGERVLEIGWSDRDVKEEIRKTCISIRGLDNKYAYFWFECTERAKDAFYLYCRLWHRYKEGKENTSHPEPPPDYPDLECPFPECEWNEKRRKEI